MRRFFTGDNVLLDVCFGLDCFVGYFGICYNVCNYVLLTCYVDPLV